MRGDSAFYNTEFMDYMHHEDIQYYIRAKSYEKIQNMIIEHLEDNGIDYLNYTNQEPYYGEIEYSPKSLSTPCRYVFKVFPAQDKQLTMFPVVNVNIKFTKSVSLIFTSSGCYDHHPQSWISYPLFDMTFL